MILTGQELYFLDLSCHEGNERPVGGTATDVMTRIVVSNADTLTPQWAYLRDKPPTGPVIGSASGVAPPLPWPNREAVLRRDGEIRAIREDMQRNRGNNRASA